MKKILLGERYKSPKRFLKKLLFGNNEKNGILKSVLIYGILIGLGFVYIYPILYMLSTSLMTTADLVDTTVTWIPTKISIEGFIKASNTLGYFEGIKDSIIMSLIPAAIQTLSLAVAGYGLARFPIPLKKVWLVIIIAIFLIPPQVTLIPRFILFNSYGLVNTILPPYITALFGQGIKSSIFLLIYYQFFSSYPKSLDEAAQIDGAGRFKIFYRIAIPMAVPAIIVTFLFSFIWFWNETTQTALLSSKAAQTLPMRLQTFADEFKKLYSSRDVSTGGALNESIRLSGTLLSIFPLLLIYSLLQSYFVESIEKTGITGE